MKPAHTPMAILERFDRRIRRRGTATLIATAVIALSSSVAPAASAEQPRTPTFNNIKLASSRPPLTDHGRVYQTNPKIYLVFWHWTSDTHSEKPELISFLKSVGRTSWLATVDQYVGQVHPIVMGIWSDNASIPSHPTSTDMVSESARAARHFGLVPDGGVHINAQIVIALPQHHSANYSIPFVDAGNYCGWHDFFADYPGYTFWGLPYTWLNYFTDKSCPGIASTAGHELAESITNPAIWGGWYGSSPADEIGDRCNDQYGTLKVNHMIFRVQKLWSNANKGCVMHP